MIKSLWKPTKNPVDWKHRAARSVPWRWCPRSCRSSPRQAAAARRTPESENASLRKEGLEQWRGCSNPLPNNHTGKYPLLNTGIPERLSDVCLGHRISAHIYFRIFWGVRLFFALLRPAGGVHPFDLWTCSGHVHVHVPLLGLVKGENHRQ